MKRKEERSGCGAKRDDEANEEILYSTLPYHLRYLPSEGGGYEYLEHQGRSSACAKGRAGREYLKQGTYQRFTVNPRFCLP